MSFSNSTFTIEINGAATAVFEAKWHGEADAICGTWVNSHRERLLAKGRHGSELPPIVKVRLSRADELARYEAGGSGIELQDDVKIVLLVDPGLLD